MHTEKPLSRRQFLKGLVAGAGVAAAPMLLAACGTQASGTAATAAPAAAAAPAATTAPAAAAAPAATAAPMADAATAPAVAQAVTVTHWDWWVTQTPWMENEIKLFQDANPGITINRVRNPDKQNDELLKAAFRDESAPDTFFTLLPFLDIIKGGYALPLNNFSDWSTYVKQYPNPSIDFAEGSNQLQGNVYSVPRDARSGWWNQIYVNTKLLKNAGWTENGAARVPKTLDEWLQAQRDVVKSSNKKAFGWGNPISTGWTPVMYWFMGQLSGAPFGGDNFKTGKYDFTSTPAWQNILEAFAKMRDEGLITPESASIDDEGIRALFAEDRFLFLTTGVWSVAGWAQTHPNFSEYTVMAPPLVGVQTPVTYYQTSPGQTGTASFIYSKSKNPEAAWKWYQWVNSRDAMKRWNTTGNGLSLWSEDNKPENATNDALKALATLDAQINRVAPARAIRNPDVGLVKEQAVKPDENAILSGIFSKQITDIPGTLKKLEDAKNASREQAIKDAVAAGAKINYPADYVFADWDPTKDYVTKKA